MYIWKILQMQFILHANRVCKDFEVKNLGKYYDLYLKSDT